MSWHFLEDMFFHFVENYSSAGGTILYTLLMTDDYIFFSGYIGIENSI